MLAFNIDQRIIHSCFVNNLYIFFFLMQVSESFYQDEFEQFPYAFPSHSQS